MGRFRVKPAAAAQLSILGGGLVLAAGLALAVAALCAPVLGVATFLAVVGGGSVACGLFFIDVDRR